MGLSQDEAKVLSDLEERLRSEERSRRLVGGGVVLLGVVAEVAAVSPGWVWLGVLGYLVSLFGALYATGEAWWRKAA